MDLVNERTSMEQIKKRLEDPDFSQLNPEIIKLARSYGFIKQPIELFLDGKLTWVECLETIVLLLTKEYRAQSNLLVATLQEAGPAATMLLSGTGLIKAMPKKPLNHDHQIKIIPTEKTTRRDESFPAGDFVFIPATESAIPYPSPDARDAPSNHT